MIKLKLLGVVFASVFFFSACIKDDVKDYSARDEKLILDYIAANGIEDVQRDESGLYYKIIHPGDGNPFEYPYLVTALYTGYLTNGNVFDQTEGAAASFFLSRVIRGWQIGIPKVAKGGQIQLFIPSALGYGNVAYSDIPANSVLIFDVEVIDDELDYTDIDENIILNYIQENSIEGVEKDESGLYYKIINPGEGENVPATAIVDATYKGYLTNGDVFDPAESTKTFSLENDIEGWQIGIPKIAKGGEIQLFIPSSLAYGYQGSGSIPPYSVIIFDMAVDDYK